MFEEINHDSCDCEDQMIFNIINAKVLVLVLMLQNLLPVLWLECYAWMMSIKANIAVIMI